MTFSSLINILQAQWQIRRRGGACQGLNPGAKEGNNSLLPVGQDPICNYIYIYIYILYIWCISTETNSNIKCTINCFCTRLPNQVYISKCCIQVFQLLQVENNTHEPASDKRKQLKIFLIYLSNMYKYMHIYEYFWFCICHYLPAPRPYFNI